MCINLEDNYKFNVVLGERSFRSIYLEKKLKKQEPPRDLSWRSDDVNCYIRAGYHNFKYKAKTHKTIENLKQIEDIYIKFYQ